MDGIDPPATGIRKVSTNFVKIKLTAVPYRLVIVSTSTVPYLPLTDLFLLSRVFDSIFDFVFIFKKIP